MLAYGKIVKPSINKLVIVLVALSLLSGLSCSQVEQQKSNKSKNQKVAERFIEKKGYKIVSYKGKSKLYKLTKKILVTGPEGGLIWGIQEVEPDPYIGKVIELERFIVKNHPLDGKYYEYGNWYEKIFHRLGIAKYFSSTYVSVIVVEGKPIGGTSYPVTKELRSGGGYSLDGRTLEEIKNTNYLTWHDAWMKKYKE